MALMFRRLQYFEIDFRNFLNHFVLCLRTERLGLCSLKMSFHHVCMFLMILGPEVRVRNDAGSRLISKVVSTDVISTSSV